LTSESFYEPTRRQNTDHHLVHNKAVCFFETAVLFYETKLCQIIKTIIITINTCQEIKKKNRHCVCCSVDVTCLAHRKHSLKRTEWPALKEITIRQNYHYLLNSLFISPNNLKFVGRRKSNSFFELKYSFCRPSDSAARGRCATLPTLHTAVGRMTYYKGLGKVHTGDVKVLSNKHPTQLGKNTTNLSPHTCNPKNKKKKPPHNCST
jgi:hypothetical protein